MTSAQQLTLVMNALLTYAIAIPSRVGLLSMAPIGIAGICGYMFAIIGLHTQIGFVSTVIICVVAGGAIALALALPLARLEGLYTSIGTLAFIVIATGVENTAHITGESIGLFGIPHHAMLLPSLLLLGLVVVAMYAFEHSGLGRRAELVAHDGVGAAALHVSVLRYRVSAQVLAGCLAAFAGITYAASFYVMVPTGFDFYAALPLFAYLFLGGARYWAGPLLGTFSLGLLAVYFQELGDWASVIGGAVLVIVVVVYPEGVGGAIRTSLHFRRYVARAFARGLQEQYPAARERNLVDVPSSLGSVAEQGGEI